MNQGAATRTNGPVLTQREWEVLASVADGLTTRQIAGEFELSPTTIRTYLRRIFAKLGVRCRAAAVSTGFAILLRCNPWLRIDDFYGVHGGWPRSSPN